MNTPDDRPRPPGAGGYHTLLVRKEGPVDWVTLNRPDSLNALNRTMLLELQHYFGELAIDDAVRVVVLTGAGRGFCAGLDLKEASSGELGGGPVSGLRLQRRVSEIIVRMRRAPQPIVALLNGVASGGGFALALASDIRIAAPSARMNSAAIRIGLTGCDIGISYFLPRIVGSALASELLLTGRFVDAQRALAAGLVSRVVAYDELAAAGREIADEIVRNAPLGVRLTKECLNASLDAGSLEAVIALEDRQQILAAQTGDLREGIAAFLEKRKAVFPSSEG
jgi:enoyl-CoA hydratase/carnithine racemase